LLIINKVAVYQTSSAAFTFRKDRFKTVLVLFETGYGGKK